MTATCDCVELQKRIVELEVRLASMKMISQPHEPVSRTEYVVALEKVFAAASNWIDHLEKKGGLYRDGVPGELMQALDDFEAGLFNVRR